jgi:hypothetical protein
MSYKKKRIVDLLLNFFVFISIIVFFYTIYRMSIYFVNGVELKIIFEKYIKYLIFSLVLFVSLLLIFKLDYPIKINIVLSCISIVIILYTIELTLFIAFPDQREKNFLTDKNKVNQLIKIKKFVDNQIFPFDVINEKIDIGDKKIYPLSYISNTKTFLCNEVGKDIFYISDKFGFRNSNKDWNNQVIDYLLIGDSFIHGACEEDENIISNFLKKKNISVINLGLGGAGPLRELAVLSEYAPIVKPKNVIWFYSEGTDLTKDLRGEKNNINLKKYLDDEFSQNLIENKEAVSAEIQKLIKKKISLKIKEKKVKKNEINEKVTIFLKKTKVLRLWNIRTLISSFINSGTIIDPLFFEIIETAKKRTEKWNGKIYFVYMPEARRYDNHLNRYLIKNKYRNKNLIINKLNKMNIDIIDVDKDIFDKNNNPLIYFNKKKVHYNKNGYELIANYIFKKIQNKNIK